ncbi:hypothetical protein FHY33_002789 [Xanthomonas arboricola]|nr:hypothetical protein [Xanthomonas campestris]
MGAAGSNGPGVRRAGTRRTRPRPPRAGSIPQAGLRAREWKHAPPVPRLPMRVHSGVLRHLTSPTVAGAAPDLRLAKAIHAPDSRLNHRNSGSHLRGAHGSRIGWGASAVSGNRPSAARRLASLPNGESPLPSPTRSRPSERVASRRGGVLPIPSPAGRRCPEGADEGTGRSRMPCLEQPAGVASMSATELHLAHRSGLCPRTLTPTPLPAGEGLAVPEERGA